MHLGEGAQPAAGPAAAGATPPGGDAVKTPDPTAGPGSSGAVADEDLVRQACRGNHEAFAELVRRHHGMVYNLCLRLVGQPADAADVTQEVFLRMYTRLDRFRGRARFRTWLYRIALNACQDELRRRRRRPWPWGSLGHGPRERGPAWPRSRNPRWHSLESGGEPAPPPGGGDGGQGVAGGAIRAAGTAAPGRMLASASVPNPEAAVLAGEFRAAVAAALALLPEAFRVAVVLRDLHHLSYEEIAAVLGLPPGTVRSRIHRGRLLLRDALTRAGWAPDAGGETR